MKSPLPTAPRPHPELLFVILFMISCSSADERPIETKPALQARTPELAEKPCACSDASGKLPDPNLFEQWGTCRQTIWSCKDKDGKTNPAVSVGYCEADGDECKLKSKQASVNCANFSSMYGNDKTCETIARQSVHSSTKCQWKWINSGSELKPKMVKTCWDTSWTWIETNVQCETGAVSEYYPGAAGYKIEDTEACALISGDDGDICSGGCSVSKWIPSRAKSVCVKDEGELPAGAPKFSCCPTPAKTE